MTTALLLAALLGHANLLPGVVLAQAGAPEAPSPPLALVVSEFQFFQARIEAFLAEASCDW